MSVIIPVIESVGNLVTLQSNHVTQLHVVIFYADIIILYHKLCDTVAWYKSSFSIHHTADRFGNVAIMTLIIPVIESLIA